MPSALIIDQAIQSYEGGKGYGQGGGGGTTIHECIHPSIYLSIYLSIRHGREKDYEVEWIVQH